MEATPPRTLCAATILAGIAAERQEGRRMAVVDAEPDGALEDAVRGRERAEAELRETQRRLRTLLRSLPVTLLTVDRKGIITALEGRTLPGLSVRPGDVVGESVFAYRDDPARQARWRRALNGETFTEVVETDAPGMYHESHYAPMRDDAGQVAGAIAVGVDVTERIETERALHESEARYRDLFEHAADMIITVDYDGAITDANSAALRTYGYTLEEFRGLRPEDYTDAAHVERTEERRIRRRRGEEDLSLVEVLHHARDGTPIWVESRARPLRDETGGVTGAQGILRNITDRKRAEEGRRESDTRLRMVVRNAPVALVATDTDGTYTVLDGKGLQAAGLRPGELVGQSIHERMADRPEIIELWRRALAGEELSAEVWGSGRRRVYEGHFSPIRDAQGAVTGAIAVRVDVTAERAAREALRETAASLARAQRMAHVGHWEWDLASDTLTWSEELYRILGLDPGEADASFETFMDRVPPADREHALADYEALRSGAGTEETRYRIIRPDGTVRILYTKNEAMLDKNDAVVGLRGFIQDVTEQEAAAERLRRAEEERRESDTLLRTVVRNAPVMLLAADTDGTYTFSDGKELQARGLQPGELVGKSVHEWPADRPDIIELWRRALGGEEPSAEVQTSDGRRVYDGHFSPIRDAQGAVTGAIAVRVDVTAERAAREALRETAASLARAQQMAHVGHWEWDTVSDTLTWSEELYRILGLDPGKADASLETFVDRVHPADRERALADYEAVRSGARRPDSRYRIIRPDGTVRVLYTNNEATLDENDDVVGLRGFVQDVTEQEAAAERLRRADRERAQLVKRLLHAQETERRTVAAEIHDGTQQLAGAGMFLEAFLSDRRHRESSEVEAYLVQVRALVGGALTETRRIMAGLRPLVLDQLGLVPALRGLAEERARAGGAAIQVVAEPPDIQLDPEIESVLFRIAQEAITNACKHAPASAIAVRLAADAATVRLEVRDDGAGFNPETLAPDEQDAGRSWG